MYRKKTQKSAEDIGRDPTTISRKIKTNRSYIHGSFYLNNNCKCARRYTQKHVCNDEYCETPCVKCRNYYCREGRSKYTSRRCIQIEKQPYVSTGAHKNTGATRTYI